MSSATPQHAPPKEKRFDPSRIPASDEARQLIADVMRTLAAAEARVRRRRAADQEIHEAALSALVCDLVHRHLLEPEGWITVEMSKTVLSPAKRRAPFMTEKFADLVQMLAAPAVGLVALQKGRYTPFGGIRSTIRASDRLAQQIEALGMTLSDFSRDPSLLGSPLELRAEKVQTFERGKIVFKASKLPLPDLPLVSRMREEMDGINAWIAQADIGWHGDEIEDRVDLGNRFLKRIFNNGRFDANGRLYGGFWQPLSADTRLQSIWIDAQPVASLDFAQSALRQAYAHVGAPLPPGDLYEIPGLGGYRGETKKVINALLSADQLPTRFPRESRGRFPGSWKFGRVYGDIARHHGAIVPLFGTGQGLHFMHQESEVLLRVLLRLQALGVVALPIHDCVLVSQSNALIAKTVMEAAFKEVTGAVGVVEMESPPSSQSREDSTKATRVPPLSKGEEARQGGTIGTIGMTSVLPISGGRKAA